MNKILFDKKARELCMKWQEELDNSQLGKKLLEKSNGRMFGILVCTDNTVYKAFSGLLFGSSSAEGFVPPCYNEKDVSVLLQEADLRIKTTSDINKKSSISKECWEKLKTLFKFTCFDGQTRTLNSIFPNAPAGTGDCCAPRLLSYCYSQGKKPLSLAEFYYGNGTKVHKEFYTPCDERCKGILKSIIGLDIVYLDEDIVVVNKESGLLAIEGKGPDKADCVASRVRNLFPDCIAQPCIHRLDQSTSGLMVLGLTKQAHDKLSSDFENRNVYKEYEALVDGKITETDGIIELPIRLDTDNRPVQIVDFENGKKAVTEFTRIGIERVKTENGIKYYTRLTLIPKTGRTHQLRVHCAKGLHCPILNDPIYGTATDNSLCLTAKVLEFNHPVSGDKMHFEIPVIF